jgi:exosortase E/protease (VPEID-CTERM system)
VSLTLSPGEATRSPPPDYVGITTPCIAAAALLVLEYLLTSYVVDVRPLDKRDDWLGSFGSAGSAGPIVLSIVTATVVIRGRRLLEEIRSGLDRASEESSARSPRRRLTSLVVHLAGFTAFLSLTIFFAQVGEDLPRGASLLAMAWIGSLIAALLALANSIIPLRALLPVAVRASPVVATGAMIGMAAWAAGVATVRFWDPLSGLTLDGSSAVLRAFSSDVSFHATTATLTFEGFGVILSPVCSGYEGIGLITVLMSAYLWAFRARLRFPHVLALLPIGIALAWFANVLRISSLMLVGARWSADLAMGSFHSKAGWVLFCALALGLVAFTRNAAVFSRTERKDGGATWNPTAAYLTPLLALVAVHMVTGLFTDGLPLLYPIGILGGAAALWWHRGAHPWLFRPPWSWEACAIGVAAFAVWLLLEPAHEAAALDDWRRGLAALPLPVAALWIAFRAFGSVIVVPLVEELAFRGYLLRRLLSADFTAVAFSKFGWLSLLVSSAAYGLLHERWLAGVVAGVLFAFAQYRRGRLSDAVLAHAVANLLVAVQAIGWQRWSFWS